MPSCIVRHLQRPKERHTAPVRIVMQGPTSRALPDRDLTANTCMDKLIAPPRSYGIDLLRGVACLDWPLSATLYTCCILLYSHVYLLLL